MQVDKLLNTLFEIELQRDTIINMVIRDELLNDEGIMSLTQEGGAFKVYLKGNINGYKDFIIFFDRETENKNKGSYFSNHVPETDESGDPTSDKVPFRLPSIYIDDLEPNRIKILYIQDLMTMQSIVEINDFLEA